MSNHLLDLRYCSLFAKSQIDNLKIHQKILRDLRIFCPRRSQIGHVAVQQIFSQIFCPAVFNMIMNKFNPDLNSKCIKFEQAGYVMTWWG